MPVAPSGIGGAEPKSALASKLGSLSNRSSQGILRWSYLWISPRATQAVTSLPPNQPIAHAGLPALAKQLTMIGSIANAVPELSCHGCASFGILCPLSMSA
jgi:hypothetical protein